MWNSSFAGWLNSTVSCTVASSFCWTENADFTSSCFTYSQRLGGCRIFRRWARIHWPGSSFEWKHESEVRSEAFSTILLRSSNRLRSNYGNFFVMGTSATFPSFDFPWLIRNSTSSCDWEGEAVCLCKSVIPYRTYHYRYACKWIPHPEVGFLLSSPPS
jgi:hypothetical protein